MRDHAPCWVSGQSQQAVAGGESVRMDEADRRAAESETARLGESGVAVRVYLCRLQPAADSETAGAVCMRATGSAPLPAPRRPQRNPAVLFLPETTRIPADRSSMGLSSCIFP